MLSNNTFTDSTYEVSHSQGNRCGEDIFCLCQLLLMSSKSRALGLKQFEAWTAAFGISQRMCEIVSTIISQSAWTLQREGGSYDNDHA